MASIALGAENFESTVTAALQSLQSPNRTQKG